MDPSTWQIIADEWRKAGMSDHGIAGVLANVSRESNFDPTLRHPDQPRWTGEAHYAHGLYQEGGEEWNNYAKWLNGRDWQDPRLQSQFAAQNLRDNYPKVWKTMSESGNPVVAGSAYASGYLKPQANFLTQRIADFQRNGVPGLDDYANGTIGTPQNKYASPAVSPSLTAASAPTDASVPAPQPDAPSGTDANPLAKTLAKTMQQQPLTPAQFAPLQLHQRQPMSPMQAEMMRNMMAGMVQDEPGQA